MRAIAPEKMQYSTASPPGVAGQGQPQPVMRPLRKKKSTFRRFLRLFIVVMIGVGAGIVSVILYKYMQGKEKGVNVGFKFVNVDAAGDSQATSTGRRLLAVDNSIGASSTEGSVNVEMLGIGDVSILLCQEANVGTMNIGGRSQQSISVNGETCVNLLQPKARGTSFGGDVCANAKSEDEKGNYVNFMDPDDLDAKLNIVASIPPGTYKWAKIETLTLTKLKADAMISSGNVTHRIYTKECGDSTCGSECIRDFWSTDMRHLGDCRGPVPYAELGEVAEGETNSVGDFWTPSPFETLIEPERVPNGFAHNHHYWRRCEHDMSLGPSDTVFFESSIRRGSFVKFLHPLVIEEPAAGAAGNPTDSVAARVELAFTTEGVVTADAQQMNEKQRDSAKMDLNGMGERF